MNYLKYILIKSFVETYKYITAINKNYENLIY